MIASVTCIRILASRTSQQSIQVARLTTKQTLLSKKKLHESVGYTNPFSPQESTIILDKVNSLSAAELSKFMTKKGSSQIAKHRTTKGLFNVSHLPVKTFNGDGCFLKYFPCRSWENCWSFKASNQTP